MPFQLPFRFRAAQWWGHCFQPCLNGIDNNVDLSSTATCLRSQGYRFAGRYLGGPCYPGTPLSASEAQILRQAGLKVVSLYSGANTVATFTCGVQNYRQGRHDGLDAAALAQSVGQPCESAIYLDLEGNQTSPVSTWLAYVRGWVRAVTQTGYLPGIYSSPPQLQIIQPQWWGKTAVLYWVVRVIGTELMVPAPCPSTTLPFAAIWQYVEGIALCAVPGADIDSAQNTCGMW